MNDNEKQDLLRARVPELLYWYRASARVMPWRSDPTPYHVWISEIMLQQTRVEAVRPYYAAFLEALPDIASLAAVSDEKLMKLWEGLGYYSRARNLKKAAAEIVEKWGGALPADRDALLSLPGVGAYTAGAIASIAFGLPEPAVDGNVLRVLTRLFADGREITDEKTKKAFSDLLRGVYETYPDSASLLTQALMELGATVCQPNGAPACSSCPWEGVCAARAEGRQNEFPVKAAKKPRRIEDLTVLLLSCPDGTYAIRKRTEHGLLAGLYEFPNVPGVLSPAEAERAAEFLGMRPVSVKKITDAVHIFTHIEWHMTGYLIECGQAENVPLLLASPEEIEGTYALASAFSKYRDLTGTGRKPERTKKGKRTK